MNYVLFVYPVENVNALMENKAGFNKTKTKNKTKLTDQIRKLFNKIEPNKKRRKKHTKIRKLDCDDLHTCGQCVVQRQNVQIRTRSMPKPDKIRKRYSLHELDFFILQDFPHLLIIRN